MASMSHATAPIPFRLAATANKVDTALDLLPFGTASANFVPSGGIEQLHGNKKIVELCAEY
jgi:hypothetical protein